MIKKNILYVLTLMLLVSSMFAVPISAGKVNLGGTSVGNGITMYWYPPNNTNGHYVNANTSVKLYFSLGSAERNVAYGLMNKSGNKTKFASFSGSLSSSTSKTISTSGYYRPYLSNYSAGTITVNGSSYIEY